MTDPAQTPGKFFVCVGISLAIGVAALVGFLFVAVVIGIATDDITFGPCGFGSNQDPILIYLPAMGSVVAIGSSYVLLRKHFEKKAAGTTGSDSEPKIGK